MSQRIRILNEVDNDTARLMIESAYNYLVDPKSVPLQKLALSFRVGFSNIYEYFNKILSRMGIENAFLEIDKMIKDDQIKGYLKEVISKIHENQSQKIRLLQLQYTPIEDLQFQLGSQKRKALPFTKNFMMVKQMHWKINVALSNNYLQRVKVLKPQIVISFDFEDGASKEIVLNFDQFEELRRTTAIIIKHLHYIECVKQIQ